MLNNNRIGYLHFWCQKVLPLVYDNSLSYLETLFKVKEKLNEVIKFTNQIPEYIDKKFIEEFDEEHLKELISEVFRTIEDAISANNEGTNTHFSTDYPNAGTLVWHDNKLYKTIHPIDAGDTVIPNSNIELVNFGDMFNDFLDEVKTRFTDNDDGLRETSSTDRPVHDLVWLKNELYEVIKPIAEGNAYIYTGVNKNVSPINLDKIYDYLLDLINSEINSREEEDNRLAESITENVATINEHIDTEVEDINERINTEVNDINSALNQEIEDRTNSMNGLQTQIEDEIGNLDNLDTSDKTNLVNAINEVNIKASADTYTLFEQFGAKGDGITDDTEAINTALNSGAKEFKLLAGKTYLVSRNIYIRTPHTHITGEENSCIKCADNSYSTMYSVITIDAGTNLSDIELDNFTIDGNCTHNIDYGIPDASGNLPKHYAGQVLALVNFTSVPNVNIHNMKFINAWNGGLYLSDCPYSKVSDNLFQDCRVHAVAIRNTVQVSVHAPYNVMVNDNVIQNSVVGIENIFGVFDVTISGNLISGCDDMNKFPSYAFDGTYPNVYPKDNRFNTPSSPNYITPAQEGDGAGIESTGLYTDPSSPTTSSITYANNIVENCEVGLRAEEATNDVNMSGNVCYGNHKYGIFIFSCRKANISNNVCNYNYDGIHIQNLIDLPTNIIINANQISSNNRVGVSAECDSIVISNNSFDNNPFGIEASVIMKHAIIANNVFTDYYGISNTGINMTNIVDNAIIANNSFDVPYPIANIVAGQMHCFKDNFNYPNCAFGAINIDSSLSGSVTFDKAFPFPPYSGEIQITPYTLGMQCGVTNITTTGFTITSNIAGTVAWKVDFNR